MSSKEVTQTPESQLFRQVLTDHFDSAAPRHGDTASKIATQTFPAIPIEWNIACQQKPLAEEKTNHLYINRAQNVAKRLNFKLEYALKSVSAI